MQPQIPETTARPAPAADASDQPVLSRSLGQAWLAWQCRMIAGVIRGVIFPVVEEGIGRTPLAMWPGSGEGQQQLLEAAQSSLHEPKGTIVAQQRYGPENTRTCDIVVAPLVHDSKVIAVLAVMMSTRSAAQHHAVLQLLQWGGMWVDTLLQQQVAERRSTGAYTLSLTTAIVCHTEAHAAAIEVVNRLAERLEAERVSIGFRQGIVTRLQALSHVANFDARTQLVRQIEAAMEESIDQACTLTVPVDPGSENTQVIRAHQELCAGQGHGTICTVPLNGQNSVIGAITIERSAGQPFDRKTVGWLESLGRIIGPALELKQREERSLWFQGREAFRKRFGSLFGTEALTAKLVVAAVLVGVLLLAVIPGTHKVTALASIEGGTRQVLVAPQDGYMKHAPVRAGDLVSKGQVVASLDDRDARLEAQKWESERNKLRKEYHDALARRDRTQVSVLRARLQQAEAELALVQEKLSRLELRAPFDGAVVQGDLSQALGTPVTTGQVLFEIASLDRFRVVLEVDEYDMAELTKGSPGRLLISALPRSVFEFEVRQVIPVAVAEDGRNYFRVEADLLTDAPELRPGMQGVAKVEIGTRSLLWIWTHTLFDRIRVWFWSIGW